MSTTMSTYQTTKQPSHNDLAQLECEKFPCYSPTKINKLTQYRNYDTWNILMHDQIKHSLSPHDFIFVINILHSQQCIN